MQKSGPIIYLDYNAATPCDPRVLEAMIPWFSEKFGNPSNSLHHYGREAKKAVDNARQEVSTLINALPGEIFFTSSATESCNLAILGLVKSNNDNKLHRKRIVTTMGEHRSVLAPLEYLNKQGWEIKYLPLDRQSRISLKDAEELINEHTLLVSVQFANNEVGTIHPLRELSELAHNRGVFIHSDATQAVGKIPVDVEELDIDLMSFCSHKTYGPKGVGALYVQGGEKSKFINPITFGGGQERGIRPGTENVPGIVGFGKACVIAKEYLSSEMKEFSAMRDQLQTALQKKIAGLEINGNQEYRLPGTLNFTFPNTDAEAIILNCPNLAMGTGSSCHSDALEPSYVLTASGLSREKAWNSCRLSVGRMTSPDEVEFIAEELVKSYRFCANKRNK